MDVHIYIVNPGLRAPIGKFFSRRDKICMHIKIPIPFPYFFIMYVVCTHVEYLAMM